MTGIWPWTALVLLGAYHGLNPAMGWLFALALGLQEKRRKAVAAALLPIALGHAAAIAIAVLILDFIQHLLPAPALKWTIAAVIFSLGVYRLFRASHPRGAGMRVGGRDLFLWSFLMASAHGAGLMVIPVLMGHFDGGMHHAGPLSMHVDMPALTPTIIALSVAVHTVAMLVVAGTISLVFFELYDKIGLKVLRHAWLNFDLLWACALLIAAVAVLLL
jgi:hypothetical protein